MLVKVFSKSFIEPPSLTKRFRIKDDGNGVASTCWTFLVPASWVKTDGHLIEYERSICSLASYAGDCN